MNHGARIQAQLSLKRGGLGLRSCQRHASAAYISSASTFHGQTDLASAITAYNLQVQTSDQITEGVMSQRRLSNAIEKQDFTNLAEQVTVAERVILEAISAKHASDWLTVTPSPGLGFRFLPEEFQTLVKMRLRLPLYADGISCPLCTDKTLDKLGYHAVTCGRGPDVVSRHNALRDYLYNVCRQAGFCPALEQGAGLNGTRTRPADILIPTWSLGRAGAIDVTCTNPLTPTHLTGATVSVTDCLESAERKKHDENDAKCHELNWTCLPVATNSIWRVWDREQQDPQTNCDASCPPRQRKQIAFCKEAVRWASCRVGKKRCEGYPCTDACPCVTTSSTTLHLHLLCMPKNFQNAAYRVHPTSSSHTGSFREQKVKQRVFVYFPQTKIAK